MASDVQEEYDDVPIMDQLADNLEIPEDAEIVGGIVFESFAELLEGGVPEAQVLVDDVLYAEGLHIVSGHPGDGKTSWLMQLAWLTMSQGRHVVWLDYEGGIKPTLRRLLAVGVPGELLLERFHYASFPAHAEQHLEAVGERWPGALVVMDSFSKALAYAGVNENDPPEVTQWTVPVVKTCKQHGMPIVIIDHVPKNAPGSKYSRGAGSKLADVDVHWRVEKVADFNRDTVGGIEVRQMKDREGYLPFATWWTMGDGQGRLTVVRLNEPPPADGDADSPSI